MKKTDAFKYLEENFNDEQNVEKIANVFSEMLNCCSGGLIEDFVKQFYKTKIEERLHTLFVNWLYICSKDEYKYDERNKASHIVAKEIVNEHQLEKYLSDDKMLDVCKQMLKDHRTIQQNFTRLAVNWLSECEIITYKSCLPYI
jgi:hypothetical protein